ncbi:lytic transglycosylase domain-containing protein [Chromobacterium rhizoryzae]|uniref:Lytic transglycosylase domain-containing protein n=1 Tax=Chromobacterium rhizoryzae TaxID=1778675 RepID=A0AAD0RWF4_9NEIS|nr:lytic transglycosylase domain-containing protein [Chromobacterium rhizoryzae]AXT48526.1 lytic transglycosylase domain-containing protein [Chromobacterium rhizoryzae]
MIRSGIVVLLAALAAMPAWAGAQKEEALAANVASTMRRSVSDANAPRLVFDDQREADAWLGEMSSRLAKRIPDKWTRERLLTAIHYEATRAGLDPQLVLGLIQVESGFNKYAISGAGARGLMQVMPFWVRSIGNAQHNLFDLTTNLRYGCTILRYYLDIERGNLFRALGRYNGSLGRAEYPNLVMGAWKGRWHWVAPLPVKTAAAGATPSLVR